MPQGASPPPARLFFVLRFGTRLLGLIDPQTFGMPGRPNLLDPLGVSFEALEAFLEPPGVLLRPSWSLLERSWRPLGASLGALGGVWGPLGSLLGALGRVLGPLGRLLGRLRGDPNVTKITCPKKVNFKSENGTTTPIFGEGFGSQNGAKIGPKTSPKLRRFSRAKKLPPRGGPCAFLVRIPTRERDFQKQLGRQKCRK